MFLTGMDTKSVRCTSAGAVGSMWVMGPACRSNHFQGLEKCDWMSTPIITPRSASRIAGMVRMPPEDDLVDVVDQHWIVRWDQPGSQALRHEVLPDPSINLVVEPAGRLLYGVGSGRFVHELTGRGTVVGTKFRPGGFSG